MKAKEKAYELVDRFIYLDEFSMDWDADEYIHNAKQCALIAVDEILQLLKHYPRYDKMINYWNQVKQEIEKL